MYPFFFKIVHYYVDKTELCWHVVFSQNCCFVSKALVDDSTCYESRGLWPDWSTKARFLKPQDNFGELNKFFLDLQKVQEMIRKHHQTFLQLFWMTYCNAILPSSNLGQSVRGDSEHLYVLAIFWKWKHFGANWTVNRALIVHTTV